MNEPKSRAELLLYATEDGSAQFFLRAEDGSVWLSQSDLGELFQTSIPNVNIHIKNVLDEGELTEVRTVKDDLIVQTEGTRQLRLTDMCELEQAEQWISDRSKRGKGEKNVA